jgi:hypothetical protein
MRISCWKLIVLAAFFGCSSAFGQILMDQEASIGPAPENEEADFSFEIPQDGMEVGMQFRGDLERGRGGVVVRDAEGALLANFPIMPQPGQPLVASDILGPFDEGDELNVEVRLNSALGEYQVTFVALPQGGVLPLLAGEALLMLIAAALLLGAALYASRAHWVWLLVGAGLWLLGALLNGFVQFRLNRIVMEFLEDVLDGGLFLTTAAAYLGLIEAFFVVGAFVAVVALWSAPALTWRRALAAAGGAAALEPLLFGVRELGKMLSVTLSWPASENVEVLTAAKTATTAVSWMAGPLGVVMIAVCLMAGWLVTMRGLVRSKNSHAAYGYVFVAVVLAAVRWPKLLPGLASPSGWWLVLALAPLVIVAALMIRWSINNWPDESAAQAPE